MRVYAVLDLKGGHVVHGIAGQRDRYQRIASRLTRSTLPGEVARAIVEAYEIKDAYVADLDAIAGSPPDLPSLTAITEAGLRIIVDAGVSTLQQASPLLDFDDRHSALSGIIVGLETTRDQKEWPALVRAIGSERSVLSLDLKDGRPLTSDHSLANATPLEIVDLAWLAGFRRLIVLDLLRVGTRRGPSTLEICQALRSQGRWTELITGGGVRGAEDLRALEQAGCHAALVATALHERTW
jgi:HisA/HisF family protein